MKYVLILILVAIVISLFQAMYYLGRDSGNKDRSQVVKALTVRITLSLLLFVLAIVSVLFGLVEPHGVQP